MGPVCTEIDRAPIARQLESFAYRTARRTPIDIETYYVRTSTGLPIDDDGAIGHLAVTGRRNTLYDFDSLNVCGRDIPKVYSLERRVIGVLIPVPEVAVSECTTAYPGTIKSAASKSLGLHVGVVGNAHIIDDDGNP